MPGVMLFEPGHPNGAGRVRDIEEAPMRLLFLLLMLLATAGAQAKPLKLGIVAFQMSSPTHARAANAAEAAAKALGWKATLLDSRGSIPESAAQIENLIAAKVDAMVLCMTRPIELDAQLAAAKGAHIPLITIASGTSPHTLFDIRANEYQVGSDAALYLLNLLNYRGSILTQRFDDDRATRIRGRMLDAVLAENTAVKVLASHAMAHTANWQQDVRAGMGVLLRREAGKFQGIWASFDGQALVIDDLLQHMGVRKGQVPIVSMGGGQEIFARIRDPKSAIVATMAVPFELMGRKAIEYLDMTLANGANRDYPAPARYLRVPALLVDRTNVPLAGKWPW
jgi:simple sugar transport system substrate-binding protein/ribose transport system substrate-binding protein